MQETIILGEREYTLEELPLRKARAFREQLKSIFTGITDLLEGAPDTQLNDTKAVASLIRSVSSTILDSIDTATDLLCDYSSALADDREYIEDNAVGSQVVDAFITMITLVFPFLAKNRLMNLGRAMGQIGSNTEQT